MSAFKKAGTASILMSGLCLFACAADVGQQGPADSSADGVQIGDTPLADDGLVDKATPVVFRGALLPSRNIGNASADLCMLTGITGSFNGNDTASVLRATSGNWITSGERDGNFACVNRSGFVRPSGSGAVMISELLLAGMTENHEWPMDCNRNTTGNPNNSGCEQLWWGDAFSFISYVYGGLQSGSDYIAVYQNPQGNTSSWLYVYNSENGATTTAGVYSAFVGVPQRAIKLLGYNTATGAFVTSGGPEVVMTFNVATDGGFSSWWMPPQTQALCGLTRISGNFDSTSQRVRISLQNHPTAGPHQFLEVTGSVGDHVRANSRCVAYDQR